MQNGTILNQSDIKEILIEFFNVNKESVVSTKYSFLITEESEEFNTWKAKKKERQ